MLIAGGPMIIIGFAMVSYYGIQFINSVQDEERLKVEPRSSMQVKQNINGTEGAYLVMFPDFGGKPTVTLTDPAGQLVTERSVSPPIVFEPFDVAQPGVYTLEISNPTDQILQPYVVLGDQKTVSQDLDVSTTVAAFAFTLILGIGVAVAVAGGVITILDRRRIGKMKQFGDTSDLV